MISSSNKITEVGTWIDLGNLIIVCVTLSWNGFANRKEKIKLFKLQNSSTWFNRLVLEKISDFDNFFNKTQKNYDEAKIGDRRKKISIRKEYQKLRADIRDTIVSIKAFDAKLHDCLNQMIESYENKLFSNQEVTLEELREYKVYFTGILINYEKNEYKILK
ncbi:MAG: hypothetical protein ACRC6A_07560 [Fusobacteriaceae bacterium]